MSEQTVAEETDELAQQNSEEDGAQDDLDTLLKQYDEEVKVESTSTEKPAEKKSEADDDTPERQWIRSQMDAEQKREVQEGRTEVVAALKEALDFDVPERIAWGFVHAAAEEDPRIVKVFQNRKNDPTGWKRVLGKLQKEFKSEFTIDASATSDRRSVEAAIRGASSKTASSDEPQLSQMSNSEFEAYKMGLRRKG